MDINLNNFSRTKSRSPKRKHSRSRNYDTFRSRRRRSDRGDYRKGSSRSRSRSRIIRNFYSDDYNKKNEKENNKCEPIPIEPVKEEGEK